ncbi:hypothetical protein BH10PLA2_BH10PLA2_36980 [soil metagenome]
MNLQTPKKRPKSKSYYARYLARSKVSVMASRPTNQTSVDYAILAPMRLRF